MKLAIVKGNLVSTQKDKNLIGQKLLIVHPTDLQGKKIGRKDVVAHTKTTTPKTQKTLGKVFISV